MGRATIVANLGDARYTVRLDYGEQRRLDAIAALDAELTELAGKIVAQQAVVAQADAAEAQLRAVVLTRFDAVVATQPSGAQAPSAAYKAALEAYAKAIKELAALEIENGPKRRALDALQAERSGAAMKRKELADLVTLVERDAWCVTYTTGGSGEVAVHEIPGELPLVVIAAGCRAPVASDGYLLARELMSPEQAFFNVAVLPGWQAFMPTFRWGTVDAINWAEDTCALTLADAVSSAQGLGVNAGGTVFLDVPIVYQSCHARAFSLGDRVVVQFDGQSWTGPRVIGFLDRPRPCPPKDVGAAIVPQCAMLQYLDIFAGKMLFQTLDDHDTVAGMPPLAYEIIDGALPPGIAFDTATSRMTGQLMTAGEWSCTVRCADAGYNGVNRRYADEQITFRSEQTFAIAGADMSMVEHAGFDIHDRWELSPVVGGPPNVQQTRIQLKYTPADGSGVQVIADSGVVLSVEVGSPIPACQRAWKSYVVWSMASNADEYGNSIAFDAPLPVQSGWNDGAFPLAFSLRVWPGFPVPVDLFTYTCTIAWEVHTFIDGHPATVTPTTPKWDAAYDGALANFSGTFTLRLSVGG